MTKLEIRCDYNSYGITIEEPGHARSIDVTFDKSEDDVNINISDALRSVDISLDLDMAELLHKNIGELIRTAHSTEI